MKILLVMKFWWDGQENSTRSRNVSFTWQQLKNLSVFLDTKGVQCSAKLYDFSPEKIIEDSNHIPYPLGEYKKSEKTNIILKENIDFDFVFMFDSDAFFTVQDYEKVLDIIIKLEKGDMITFDLAKLEDKNVRDIVNNKFVDKENTDWSYAYSGEKKYGPLAHGHRGNLGGVYLCDIKLILESGGFDEAYVGWGGEDGRMVDKIQQSKLPYKHKPTGDFSPFHLPHYSDWGNEKYSKRFND
jgi:predicted glycosyltransferase involved in capsule biosynthesis